MDKLEVLRRLMHGRGYDAEADGCRRNPAEERRNENTE